MSLESQNKGSNCEGMILAYKKNKLCLIGILYILFFPIPHNARCLPPQILHKLLLRNALGNMKTSQEYFTTIISAKFGGQTECIMDNWKIVKKEFLPRNVLSGYKNYARDVLSVFS